MVTYFVRLLYQKSAFSNVKKCMFAHLLVAFSCQRHNFVVIGLVMSSKEVSSLSLIWWCELPFPSVTFLVDAVFRRVTDKQLPLQEHSLRNSKVQPIVIRQSLPRLYLPRCYRNAQIFVEEYNPGHDIKKGKNMYEIKQDSSIRYRSATMKHSAN